MLPPSPLETNKQARRRAVHLASIDDLLHEAERLRAASAERHLHSSGNWSLAQALWHIAKLIELSFDGFSWRCRRGPLWITRTIRYLSWRWLIRMAFRPGFINPPEAAAIEPQAISLDEAIDSFRRQIGRIQAGEQMMQESAIEGPYSHEQWIYIHLRHAELHLSFFEVR